jgi:hypothetical protein
MDNTGRQAVVNQSSGVYWSGLWLSNTYAWSASKSAGAKPVGIKKAHKQVKEKPEARSSYKGGYIGWEDYSSYEVGSYGVYKKPVQDVEELIESNLDDLEYMGFTHSVTMGMALDFVDEFGIDSFLDVVDQAIDGQLPIDWFDKVMGDHKVARECFPYLGRHQATQ